MSNLNDIPNGWVETTLGSIMDISSGKTRPKIEGKIPIYGGNGIMGYGNNFNQEKPSIIVGRVGAYCGAVYIEKKPFWLSDNALGVRNKPGSDLMFLYYKLKSMKLNNHAIGGAQPLVTQSLLKELEIEIPKDKKEQKAIANILTAFDDKIENLQAQNQTLEQTAQTIFKEWFGKYQLGDELPDGWCFEKLETIADHKKNNIKPFNHPERNYLHFSLPAYDNGLVPEIEKGATIKSNKYKVFDNCFLVSKLNPFTPRIWTIFNSNDNHICSTEFQVVKPKSDKVFSLIHCFLNSKRFTAVLSQKIKGTSSSHQRVNPQDIFDVRIIIPNENSLVKFRKEVETMVLKKNINHQQIQTLKKTRDTLLPKLMSGKLRVK